MAAKKRKGRDRNGGLQRIRHWYLAGYLPLHRLEGRKKADIKTIEEYEKYREKQDLEHLTAMDRFYNKYLSEYVNKGDYDE